MLGARSMALVGASPRPDSFGSRMVLEAQRGSARFHLVNPRYDRIGELPCVPSIAEVDEPVDVVLLGVPDAALPDQLAAAAAAGAKSAVLFGSAHGLKDEITAYRRRRRNGGVRCGLHGLREQRARCAGAGLSGAGSVARWRRQPRHPLGFCVLDAAACAPRVRFPAGGVVRTGARHRRRRLRRLRAGRSRNTHHRTAARRRRAPFPGCGRPFCAPRGRTCPS